MVNLVGPNLSRVPALFDPRSPTVWARHITVPVFMAGALEDEQVGPQWPAVIRALRHDPNVYVTMMNGTHIDSLGPETISRWLEFLDIYVAQAVPTPAPILDPLMAELYSSATGGAPSMTPPAIRFTDAPLAGDGPLCVRGGHTQGAGAVRLWRGVARPRRPSAGRIGELHHLAA